MIPTPEQQAILDAALTRTESMFINARAGCGKSSTLEMLARAMPQEPSLALAFNLKIKKELERRLPPHFTVLTMNGLGHRAWCKAIGKFCEVDDKKLGKLVTEVAKAQGTHLNTDQWVAIRSLCSAAQQAGLVPSGFANGRSLVPDTFQTWEDIASERFVLDFTEQHMDLARAVLTESINLAYRGVISYDDQIYMSVCFGGVFPRFPRVFVDEVQDLSQLNHKQVSRVAADRIIGAGDTLQSIYQFRGADGKSIDNFKLLRDTWIDLPLFKTFRCPKSIVALAQAHAPGFTAADGNAEGVITRLEGDWSWDKIPDGEAAVLCRNNAPLLAMAFQLIKRGVPCVMLGRDIGKGLIALAKKLLPNDETMAEDCIQAINKWADSESMLARANDHEEKVSAINDRRDCLLAVLEYAGAPNAKFLRSAIEQLFARDSAKVTLATGHRAKGLEWTTVVHLDPWRIPSKYARAAADRGNPTVLEQELNLQYVINTRSKHNLIFANLEDFQ